MWKVVLNDGSVVAHILVYVDDLLILSSRGIAEAFHSWVKSKWGCSDLDNATPSRPLRFLGVDIFEVNGEYGIQGYALSQEGYIDELLRSHGLQASARAIVPLPRDWIREQPPEERDYPEATLREAQKITGGTALALPSAVVRTSPLAWD